MKKYQVDKYNKSIKVIEVIKETKYSVWVERTWGGKIKIEMRRKESNYDPIFDTWNLAHDYLLEKTLVNIVGYYKNMCNEKDELQKILAIEKPEGI